MRLLALTHVSPRYFGPELADEAREVFPATVVPRDFDVIEVPFPERGEPRLVKGGARADREAWSRDQVSTVSGERASTSSDTRCRTVQLPAPPRRTGTVAVARARP